MPSPHRWRAADDAFELMNVVCDEDDETDFAAVVDEDPDIDMPPGNAYVNLSEDSDELQVDGLELNNLLEDDDLLYEDELVALSDEEGERDTVNFLLFEGGILDVYEWSNLLYNALHQYAGSQNGC